MRAVVCSKCRRRPKSERELILVTDEVHGFLSQKNISAKNIKRLEQLVSIDDSEFQEFRSLVLAIATVHPRKRRRWKVLPKQHPELFQRIVDSEFFDYLLDEFYVSEHHEELDSYEDHRLLGVWLENQEP